MMRKGRARFFRLGLRQLSRFHPFHASPPKWTSSLSSPISRLPEYSVLEAATDPGVPLIWTGCAILMAGLVPRLLLADAGNQGRH